MRPLYHRYDLFLTANAFGRAATRPARHARRSGRTPNLTSPFNCTGGPALAVLCGFTADGLPLSLQIAGRPFDDARVLRAGHAFEQASGCTSGAPSDARRSAGGARPQALAARHVAGRARGASPAESGGSRRGLRLPDQIMEELSRSRHWRSPWHSRLKRDHPREAEVSSIFDPGRDLD